MRICPGSESTNKMLTSSYALFLFHGCFYITKKRIFFQYNCLFNYMFLCVPEYMCVYHKRPEAHRGQKRHESLRTGVMDNCNYMQSHYVAVWN